MTCIVDLKWSRHVMRIFDNDVHVCHAEGAIPLPHDASVLQAFVRPNNCRIEHPAGHCILI